MNAQTLSGNVNRMNRKETERARVSNEERVRDRGGASVCGTGTVAQSVKPINDEYLCPSPKRKRTAR